MEIKRTHDRLYLGENYKENPKEYYKYIKRVIEKEFGEKVLNPDFELLDVGCETGSFLYYLRNNFSEIKLTGMDVMPELLEKVNDGISRNKISTILADISKGETLPLKKYNVVTMLGVLSIFDNFEVVIDNLLNMVADNGRLYIFGIFNPEDLDVLIKVKKSTQKDNVWESGWNCISKCSVENLIKERGFKCKFEKFQLDIEIPKHKDDPLRSWTEDMANNEKMVVSGIQLIYHFYLCEIHKMK